MSMATLVDTKDVCSIHVEDFYFVLHAKTRYTVKPPPPLNNTIHPFFSHTFTHPHLLLAPSHHSTHFIKVVASIMFIAKIFLSTERNNAVRFRPRRQAPFTQPSLAYTTE